MSENRRIKRFLLRRSKKGKLRQGETEQFYLDNLGREYPFKWLARMMSFCNVIRGCFKNGFPIAVSRLWYSAWAFYPFFFVRKDLKVENAITTLNHERIHIRQQRDIHLTISLPIIILCVCADILGWFNPIWLLCCVPFIPTLIYGLEMLRTTNKMYRDIQKNPEIPMPEVSFKNVRENTCFEREAVMHSPNEDYLFKRKFWAVLAYTGIKKFLNYGI